MAKRIRKSFSSHSQVCHVWAQQSQETGKAGKIFFVNTTDIYSYGYHYLAAKVHSKGKKKFALVRSDAYSPSTACHLSGIRGAVNGLMPYFCVPNVTDVKEAVKYLDKQARESIVTVLKSVKVTPSTRGWKFDSIALSFRYANELRAILGMKAIKFSTKDRAKVKVHLDARLKRYQELNSPEMLEKKNDAKSKRRLAKLRAEEAAKIARAEANKVREAKALEDFRNGVAHFGHVNTPFDLLRIQGDEIVTSGGARVPLEAGIRLYRAIKCEDIPDSDIIGQTIGHFTVEKIYPIPYGNANKQDVVIKIGCHEILLSEADSVLGMKVA